LLVRFNMYLEIALREILGLIEYPLQRMYPG
jgi:hypothetical protein